jgi:hypothetical protein
MLIMRRFETWAKSLYIFSFFCELFRFLSKFTASVPFFVRFFFVLQKE